MMSDEPMAVPTGPESHASCENSSTFAFRAGRPLRNSAHVVALKRLQKDAASVGSNDDLEGWRPHSSVLCKPVTSADSMQRCAKRLRATMLFLELEEQVHRIVEERKASDAREREISRQIAEKFPLKQALETTPKVQIPQSYAISNESATESFQKAQLAKVMLPPPLTPEAIRAAYPELPSGAAHSIESCLRCWQAGRLSVDDVVRTVSAFSASSPSIARLTGPLVPPPSAINTVATPEQMRELARLASIQLAPKFQPSLV